MSQLPVRALDMEATQVACFIRFELPDLACGIIKSPIVDVYSQQQPEQCLNTISIPLALDSDALPLEYSRVLGVARDPRLRLKLM